MASSIIGETFGEAMLSSFVQLYAALRHGPLQWPSLLACSAARQKASFGGGQIASPLQAALISFSQLRNWLMPRWLKVPPTLPKRSQLVLQWTFGVEEYMVFRGDPCSALIAALHVRTASRTSRVERLR